MKGRSKIDIINLIKIKSMYSKSKLQYAFTNRIVILLTVFVGLGIFFVIQTFYFNGSVTTVAIEGKPLFEIRKGVEAREKMEIDGSSTIYLLNDGTVVDTLPGVYSKKSLINRTYSSNNPGKRRSGRSLHDFPYVEFFDKDGKIIGKVAKDNPDNTVGSIGSFEIYNKREIIKL